MKASISFMCCVPMTSRGAVCDSAGKLGEHPSVSESTDSPTLPACSSGLFLHFPTELLLPYFRELMF